MKYRMDKTIKDNMPETNNANEFLESIDMKFKKFDKIEKAYYLSLLTKTKYGGISDVHEHVMKLTNWYNKLKFMKVELGSDFLVQQALDSLLVEIDMLKISYNVQKEEWSANELITILTQEELIIKKGKACVVQLASHKGYDKKEQVFKWKSQFKKNGSDKLGFPPVHETDENSRVKQRFNGKCKF